MTNPRRGTGCGKDPKQTGSSRSPRPSQLICLYSPGFSIFALLAFTAAAAKSLQSCPTLCNPIDDSPPGSPVPGILQARTLEWVAIAFSNVWKWKVKVKSLSCVRLFVTPWTAAHQAPPSMGFSRQEYWSGVPLPSPCFDSKLPNFDVLYIKTSFFPFGFQNHNYELTILSHVQQ